MKSERERETDRERDTETERTRDRLLKCTKHALKKAASES